MNIFILFYKIIIGGLILFITSYNIYINSVDLNNLGIKNEDQKSLKLMIAFLILLAIIL